LSVKAPRGLSTGSGGSRGTDDDLARQTDQGNHISIQIGATSRGTQPASINHNEQYEQYQVEEYEKYENNQYADYEY
jgi:hypothetical protein